MRTKNTITSTKSRFIAAKDLPPFYDGRIKQNRDKLEMAETHHIVEDFEFNEESTWKEKSSMEKSNQRNMETRVQSLSFFLVTSGETARSGEAPF